MLASDAEMETRVKNLEAGMKELREDIARVKDALNSALLGTIDGRPGIMATLQSIVDARKSDAIKLDDLCRKVDGLRLNWAKVAGVAVGVSFILGGFYEVFLRK